MKVISRQEAKALGLKWYFTGKPCVYGHVAERSVSGHKCRECSKEYSRHWRTRNPERAKEWKRRYYTLASKERAKENQRRRYAANPEKMKAAGRRWYMSRRASLLGSTEPTRPEPLLCECCGGEANGSGSLHLDHCHVTGLFRGWLCSKCNGGIGLLTDNSTGVRRALAYLLAAEELMVENVKSNRQTCREDATSTSDAA